MHHLRNECTWTSTWVQFVQLSRDGHFYSKLQVINLEKSTSSGNVACRVVSSRGPFGMSAENRRMTTSTPTPSPSSPTPPIIFSFPFRKLYGCLFRRGGPTSPPSPEPLQTSKTNGRKSVIRPCTHLWQVLYPHHFNPTQHILLTFPGSNTFYADFDKCFDEAPNPP